MKFRIALTLAVLLFVSLLQAQPAPEPEQSCANARETGIHQYVGQPNFEIPVEGVPDYIVEGLTDAAGMWNAGCSQSESAADSRPGRRRK